jgi:hypothetical protein
MEDMDETPVVPEEPAPVPAPVPVVEVPPEPPALTCRHCGAEVQGGILVASGGEQADICSWHCVERFALSQRRTQP